MSSVPTCPSIVLFAVVTAVLFFGLGWLLLSMAFRREEFTPLEKIPISFSLSVGSIAVIGVVGYFLGLSLKAVEYVIASLFLLLLLWQGVCWRRNRQAHRKSNGVRSSAPTLDQPVNLLRGLSSLRQTLVAACSRSLSRPDIVILIFAAFCSLLALWSGPWLSHTADSFYHLASARRLIDTQGVLPRGAFVAYESEPSGFDPTAGTWHLVLALLSVFSGVDLTWVWFYLPAILAPVLVLALYSFAVGLFKNQAQAALATILYFLLEYNLDFRMIGQPNRMGFALLWVTLLFAIRYLDAGKLRFFGLISLFGLVLGTLHFTIFEFLLISIGTYALFYTLFSAGKGVNPELRRIWTLAFIPLLFSLPIVLYKASARPGLLRLSGGLSSFRGTVGLGRGLYILDPDLLFPEAVSVQSLSFILLLLLILACWKRDRASIFLFSNMLVVPLIMFNPLVVTILQGRVTELVLTRLPLMLPYPLVVGFLFYQWGTTSLTGDWALRSMVKLSLRAFIFCISIYILLSQISENLIQLYNPFSDYKYSMSVSRSSWLLTWEDPYKFICDSIPRDAVISTDPVSSYYIGGVTGRYVIALPRTHTPPGLPDAEERAEGSLDILDQNVDLKTTVSLLRKWNADYIFVDLNAPGVDSRSPRSKFERYPKLFRKIYEKEDVSIYEYEQGGLAFAVAKMDMPSEDCQEVNARLTDDLILLSSCFDDKLIEADKYIALKLGWRPLRKFSEAIPIELRFSGVNSGYTFSATFNLGENAGIPLYLWEPNNVYEEAYVTFMPADVAMDAYEVSASLKGSTSRGEVALGRFGLRETYQAESFEDIISLPQTEGPEGFSKYSGWIRYQDYAITRDLGVTMFKDIHPIPLGDYQVLLQVYNHKNQGVNQVEVTLNGVRRVIGWDGSKGGGEEWVSAVFEGQSGGSELAITSVKREQWYIVIAEVAVVPSLGDR